MAFVRACRNVSCANCYAFMMFIKCFHVYLFYFYYLELLYKLSKSDPDFFVIEKVNMCTHALTR